MANNADVTYILTGSEKDCSLLEEAARQIMNMPQAPGWLGYMNCFIYPEQRPLYTFHSWADDRENTVRYPFWDCRGTIEDVQSVCPLNDSVERRAGLTHFVTLHCDEAWLAHSEVVHYFARKFNCRMNYMCVEPGCQVYELHDPDRVFNAKWFVNMNCTGAGELYQDMSAEDLKEDPDQIWPAPFLKYLEENDIELTEHNLCEVIDEFDNYLQEIDETGNLSASAGEFDHSNWDDFDDEVPSLESVIEKNIEKKIQEQERKRAIKNLLVNNSNNTNA